MKRRNQVREQELGRSIKKYRIMKGKSLAELAASLEISTQQMQKYEKGIDRVSASTLEKLSIILEVSVINFLEKTNLYNNDDFKYFKQSHKLVKQFSLIRNPQLQKTILSLIEEISVIYK